MNCLVTSISPHILTLRLGHYQRSHRHSLHQSIPPTRTFDIDSPNILSTISRSSIRFFIRYSQSRCQSICLTPPRGRNPDSHLHAIHLSPDSTPPLLLPPPFQFVNLSEPPPLNRLFVTEGPTSRLLPPHPSPSISRQQYSPP